MNRASRGPIPVTALAMLASLAMVASSAAQQAEGTLTANGASGDLRYAYAREIDSDTEAGYLDVRIVLADRELTSTQRDSDDWLMKSAHEDGLVALVVILDPDARAKSATPYHPDFTAIISSGAWIQWEPSAYDENVAGRFHSGGEQNEFNNTWEYDVTFSAPIELDPEAQTVE